MQEDQFLGKVRVARVLELGKHLDRELLGAHQNFPDFADHGFEEGKITLFGRDGPLPVPLIHISAVVVIEKVVFADGPHVGADALTDLAAELFQRDSFPLGGGLHHLRVERMFLAVVGDVELDRRGVSHRDRACH